jgi:hypothetical protein
MQHIRDAIEAVIVGALSADSESVSLVISPDVSVAGMKRPHAMRQ